MADDEPMSDVERAAAFVTEDEWRGRSGWHGHVRPVIFGVQVPWRAKCGGPALCQRCAVESLLNEQGGPGPGPQPGPGREGAPVRVLAEFTASIEEHADGSVRWRWRGHELDHFRFDQTSGPYESPYDARRGCVEALRPCVNGTGGAVLVNLEQPDADEYPFKLPAVQL